MFNYKSVFTYFQVQRGVLNVVNELMNEVIKETLDFKSPCFDSSNVCTFRIADFGCSAGPNTFLAMEKIMEAVEQKYHAQFQNSLQNPSILSKILRCWSAWYFLWSFIPEVNAPSCILFLFLALAL
jgi:hypothetical protein